MSPSGKISEAMVEALRKLANEVGGLIAFEPEVRQAIGNTNWNVLQQRLAEADTLLSTAALSVPTPGTGEAEHPDDVAVDRFAAAMKAKLALKREQGRSGWEDPAQCTGAHLSNLLRSHVEKGDPLDVGNLAMMLHQRGERIS